MRSGSAQLVGAVVRRASTPNSRRAKSFTLVETLVVMGIVAVLMGMLMPVLRGARSQMHTLKCTSNLRTASLQFQLFAAGENSEGRGDSAPLGHKFYINDFQDSLYRIDEFWKPPGESAATLDRDAEPTVCPAGPTPVEKLPGAPCGRDAIRPLEHVTMAVNMRLYQAVTPFNGRLVLAPTATVRVREDILNHPYVPLAFDVDARRAIARGLLPFYAAPPRPGPSNPYTDGRYWSPGTRHRGKSNVAFVGGHVLTSERPEQEPWDWGYQAQVGG